MNYGLYDLGHEVSKKCSEKYDADFINNLYKNKKNTNHKNPITIASLYKWSKEDNPINHRAIMDKFIFDNTYKKLVVDIPNQFMDIPYCETYENSFLKSLNWREYRTFLIKSSLGTNKSGECIRTITDIDENEPIDRIACIASRVILTSDLYNRFLEPVFGETENRPKNLKVSNYSLVQYKNELVNEKRLVQTPDSLIHMIDNDGKIPEIDILFIDEIESLLEYICMSDTLIDKRKLVFSIVYEYIKKSKYVFLVDGNLSRYIVEYLYDLRNDDSFKFIYNQQKSDDNEYYIISSESDWFNKLDIQLSQGKKLYIPTDSKEYSETIRKYINDKYPTYKVQLYNVDTNDEDKINMGNVNITWKTIDIIICSPTILYGVNFSEQYFDLIFGYYQTTILPGSVYQQLRRIRHVKDKKVYLFLKDQKKHSAPILSNRY